MRMTSQGWESIGMGADLLTPIQALCLHGHLQATILSHHSHLFAKSWAPMEFVSFLAIAHATLEFPFTI
jgi:hypothetical protein